MKTPGLKDTIWRREEAMQIKAAVDAELKKIAAQKRPAEIYEPMPRPINWLMIICVFAATLAVILLLIAK